jgi:hypothetical protein
MKSSPLFPHRFRLIGWLLFVPSAGLGLATLYGEFSLDWLDVTLPLGYKNPINSSLHQNNLTNEIAALGVIIGLLFIAFARELIEDEMIRQLRLEALQWSVFINYGLLALAILLTYDMAFFQVMVYNMFTILLVFIGRFRWSLYKMAQDETRLAV